MKKTISILLSLTLVLSTFAGMFSIPASAADTSATYQVFDFEDGNEPAFTKYFAESISSTSIETENSISGSNSYKVTFTAKGSTTNDGFLGIVLTEGFSSEKTYRVSGKYRVLSGTLGYFRVVNVGARTEASNFYTDAVAANRRFDVSVGVVANAFSGYKSFSGVITPTGSNGNISIGVRPSTSSTTTGMELLIDDITIAEIIDAPTAASSDATKGTATVANKSGKSDYAVGETAVFTATPNAGYAFSHWTDATGTTVSTSATYEYTLTGETTLTAHFALAGVKTFDFEDGNEPAFTKYFAESISSTSIETENSISGNNSYKVTFTAEGSTTNDGFLGIVLTEGLSSEKTYRVSGKYRVLSGTLGFFRVVNVGARTEASNFYTDAVAANRRFDVSVGVANAFSGYKSFSGVITPTGSNGNISIGVRPSTSATTGMELLIDDITIAEIIDAPTATSANGDMGTATVVNKAGHSDYAVGETAVYTAEAKRGYTFVGWKRGEQIVSTDLVYEVAVDNASDFALTAAFEDVNIATAWNNAVAVRKASASTTGKQGMRIYNSIDKTAATTSDEYGSIAIREDYLTAMQNTLGYEGFDLELYDKFQIYKDEKGVTGSAGFGRGISYKVDQVAQKNWDETETEYGFTSYLTEIDPQYYGDTYLIRSYMIDTEGNVTYGEIYKASVFNTVYNILQQEVDGDGVEAANEIIAQSNGAYDTWVNATYPAQ